MKPSTKRLIVTKLLLLICIFLFSGLANAATISFTPLNSTVNLGDPFTLSISGSGFDTPTSGGDIDISWDKSILTLASDAPPDVVFTWPVTLAPFTLTGASFLNDHTIHLGVADFGYDYGPSFSIANLHFTASGVGTSLIDVAPSAWQDINGAFLSNVEGIGGSVTVNAAATPIPGAVWLLGSGLAGLVGLRRKSVAARKAS